jgi:hypothetical protein
MTVSKVPEDEVDPIHHGGNAPGSWWRPLVDAIDGVVTPPANRIVRTNLFADAVAAATRIEVRFRRQVVRQSTWMLHQYNMPAAEDIRKLRAQLASAEARLRDLSERLEDHDGGKKAARRSAGKPRSAARKSSSGARNTVSAESAR